MTWCGIYSAFLQALMNLPQAGASGRVLRRVIDLGMSAWPLK